MALIPLLCPLVFFQQMSSENISFQRYYRWAYLLNVFRHLKETKYICRFYDLQLSFGSSCAVCHMTV